MSAFFLSRRAVALAIFFLALPALALSRFHSDLRIDAGQQFVLGGGQQGAFQVKGKNVGRVAVRVVERLVVGDTIGRGIILPGARVNVDFRPGSAALLCNASTHRARLSLDISGDLALGMTYEGVGKK